MARLTACLLLAQGGLASCAPSYSSRITREHGDTGALLLRCAGLQVATAVDARSGLDLARRTSFDIAIVDVGLPDESGFEVVRQLVADGNPCIKIVTTAFPWPHTQDEAFAAGASWFVGGLLLGDELEEIIRACGKADVTRANEMAFDGRIAISVRTTAACGADTSLESMAAVAKLSASRYRRLFSRCTKITVSTYLANLRLALAVRFVAHSDMRLTDVARRVGWWDVRYFRRRFRSRFVLSPRQYRRTFGSRQP